jgi:predicted nucleic acid-binding protein
VIILDTNVTSELMRVRPDSAVTGWLAEQSPVELFSTVITVSEISYGLERLPRGRRRKSLEQAYQAIFISMADHICRSTSRRHCCTADSLPARNGSE